jgi:hypothetical protein
MVAREEKRKPKGGSNAQPRPARNAALSGNRVGALEFGFIAVE